MESYHNWNINSLTQRSVNLLLTKNPKGNNKCWSKTCFKRQLPHLEDLGDRKKVDLLKTIKDFCFYKSPWIFSFSDLVEIVGIFMHLFIMNSYVMILLHPCCLTRWSYDLRIICIMFLNVWLHCWMSWDFWWLFVLNWHKKKIGTGKEKEISSQRKMSGSFALMLISCFLRWPELKKVWSILRIKYKFCLRVNGNMTISMCVDMLQQLLF